MSRYVVVFAFLVALSLGHAGAEAGPAECNVKLQKLVGDQGFRAIRVIKDPSTLREWLLARNLNHPAWPARLIDIQGESEKMCYPENELSSTRIDSHSRGSVVHAGDPLLIVEDAPAWHGQMEAVALGGGKVGDTILVRLRAAGMVMRAIVQSNNMATLAGGKKGAYRWD